LAKRFAILFLGILFSLALQGQIYNNLRKKTVFLYTDTVTLDTLSIIPKSVIITSTKGVPIDTTHYKILFGSARIVVDSVLKSSYQSINIEYRVFPLLFDRVYARRNYKEFLSPDSLMGREAPRYAFAKNQESVFGEQIETQGSIMRGLRFGNNQNLSVNSSLNLTFKGELGKGLLIEGAISDQSIPIQPEGTTRRLEEFDRIFLKVHRDNFSIQAGDIELRVGGEGELLTFARNIQGLAYDGLIKTSRDTLIIKTAMAVPKGKFARNQISGMEGNQGPYRLQGTNGEPFIIVLSGSEKVYVDGILLSRGEDQHYIIDYNAAEVRFTHLMPINRNSRIQVEFEYSERSYARFNTYAKVQNNSRNWRWHISAFAEQDSRNQPFDQELTDAQKHHLASIGDNLDLAFSPQVDKVDFSPEKILYQQIDTAVNGITYSIYKHSINPNLAQFRVYFTYVGPGKGNYQPDFGVANGRVYRWVAPQNGKQMGSYLDIRRLVAPQSRQMVQAGLARVWGKNSHITANYALSNTDLNTFSSLNSDDDIGHGLQLSFAHQLAMGKKSTNVRVGADFLKTSSGFQSIDRFRPVEFEREWSIPIPLNGGNEQMIGAWAEIENQRIISRIKIDDLRIGKWYSGAKGSMSGKINARLFSSFWDGSWSNSTDTSKFAEFYKARIGISNKKGYINFNLLGELENSTARSRLSNSLLPQSFGFYQLKASSTTPDSLLGKAQISYSYRKDNKPFNNKLSTFGTSQEIAISASLNGEKTGILSSTIGYRLFEPNRAVTENDEHLTRTTLARLEYSNRLFKGAWIVSGGYELGSGLEPDAEFYFVEVPAGQGVFTWVDYNGNKVMELDEFEIANFPDEAKFIRINIPGAKLISVRNNSFSARSTINPSILVKDKNDAVKFLGRFSNQSSYRVQQKNRYDDFWLSANPFTQNPTDTLITSLSASIRNSLAYNRANRRFGLEYIFTQGINKTILANGFEYRELLSNRLVMWLGLGNNISAKTDGETYSNTANSQYFKFRNYKLNGYNAQQSVKYVNNKQQTFELGYRWIKSTNELANERLISQTIFIQADLIFASKGSIMGKGSFVNNNYIGSSQSAVAYEMMKGLQPGINVTWEVSIKRRLSKLFELELGYNGRYLNEGKTIHSGTMQARALF
jgi:hypothetical protein